MSRIFNKNHSWIWINDFRSWSFVAKVAYSYSSIYIHIHLFIFIFMSLIHISLYSDVPDLQKKSFMTKCPGSSIKIIHDKMSRIFNKNHSTFIWKRQLILVCGIQDLHSGDLTHCIINKVSAQIAKICRDFGSCYCWLSGTTLGYWSWGLGFESVWCTFWDSSFREGSLFPLLKILCLMGNPVPTSKL